MACEEEGPHSSFSFLLYSGLCTKYQAHITSAIAITYSPTTDDVQSGSNSFHKEANKCKNRAAHHCKVDFLVKTIEKNNH